MLILIDGVDCTYKSTITQKVSEKLNIPWIKGSSFQLSNCSNEELFSHFKEQTELDNMIIERTIYSNQTYATIYEDYAILTDEQRHYIEDKLKNKAIVYYLFANDEVIKDRIRKRGDDYVDVTMVSRINKLFAKNIAKSPLKVIYYDTAEWTSSQIAEDIINDYTHQQVK